jgi:twitching motility protein PilT
MVCTPAIRALIRESKVHEMYGILQVSQKYGMQTLNQSLHDLVTNNVISAERALYVSNIPEELSRMLGKQPQSSSDRARGLASRTRTI